MGSNPNLEAATSGADITASGNPIWNGPGIELIFPVVCSAKWYSDGIDVVMFNTMHFWGQFHEAV